MNRSARFGKDCNQDSNALRNKTKEFGGNANEKMAKSNMAPPAPRTLLQSSSVTRTSASRRRRRYPTSFCTTLRRMPPAIPPSLLRFASELEAGEQTAGPASQNVSLSQPTKKKDNVGPGRVKVLLRVCPENVLENGTRNKSTKSSQSTDCDDILRVEGNRKHITIFDSKSGLQSAQMKVGVSAPKLYAFDAVFPEDASQIEVCSTSLVDVIQAVVQGADGAVFCYGHSGLGKTYSLIGSDVNGQEVGLIPCAISWLFRAIDEMKEKTKGRYSVRVSAIEVHGRSEHLKDLLKDFSKDDGPTDELCVREDPLFGTQLQNQCELRASSVEKAAYMLDSALAARSSSGSRSTEEARRHSHMVYTLHVYQYRLDKTGKPGVTGGRSRLHFIDLGSCERTLVKTTNSLTLSLNSLGHVIMAIINNSKHVPFKESKLTLVLQELLGNFNCRTVMLAHVAKGSKHYADTLSTVQMASRIHRVLMKKKNKSSTSIRSLGTNCHVSKSVKSQKGRGTDDESIGTSSGVGETSGSDFSCDTVIYVRPNGMPFSDRELTDNEGPPISVPIRPPPKAIESLSMINETEHGADASTKKSSKSKFHGKIPVLSRTSSNSASNRKNEFISHTQQKLASHAKLVSSLHQNLTKSKIPKSSDSHHSAKSEATAPDKRKHHDIQQSSPQRQNKQRHKSKSKIPPPPPPRLPTTRLRHNSSDPLPTPHDNALRALQTKCQPTYETLHASSYNPDYKAGSSNDYPRNTTQSTDPTENIDTARSTVADELEFSTAREDPEGCYNNDAPASVIAPHKRSDLKRIDADIAPTKKVISKCMQDFESVLNSVDLTADRESKLITEESRPTSMFVNVNDEEWVSDDDEDTYTSDNDVSEDDDVIDVNFYCLSFTTKNPLIPLSKRSFVRQVSRKKRQSLEERASDEATDNITCVNSISMTKVDESIQDHEPVNETSKLKRSATFDADDVVTPTEKQIQNTRLPTSKGNVIRSKISPEDHSIDGNSSVSSPSEVVLYDSSSLEINYVKPKSFNEGKHPANKNAKNLKQLLPKPVTNVKSEKFQKSKSFNKQILVSGSDSHGAHLSLVKTDGSSALELIITDADSSENRTSSNKKYNQNLHHELKCNKANSSPGKRSMWGGLKRFGSKKSTNEKDTAKSKMNNIVMPSTSPAKLKQTKKHENSTVKSIKQSSASSPSFVSKLLSPKLRRAQKSSCTGSSPSTDFRYRSPNVISRVKPDVARTINAKEEIGEDCQNGSSSSDVRSLVPNHSTSSDIIHCQEQLLDNHTENNAEIRNRVQNSATAGRTRFGFSRKTTKS